MRILFLIPALVFAASCGKSETPAAQAPAAQPAPAVAAAPAPAPEAAAAVPADATDAVAAPTWIPPAEEVAATAPEDAAAMQAQVPTTETPAAVSATGAETAAAPEPAPAPPAAETAAATEPAPAAPAAQAPAAAAPAPSGDAPYQVVDGKIDADTVEGWKIYRGIGTCATCHGPVGQGGVGPALVDSLKEKITKDLFVEVVANGRDGTMMKPFGENPKVMDNIDKIYAYLKARADGVLGPENLLKYPLGKIE